MNEFSLPREELVLRILEKYNTMVYRLAFSRTKSSHDAEDIMQNVFMKFIKSDVNFKSEEHNESRVSKKRKFNYKGAILIVVALLIVSILVFAKEKLEFNNMLANNDLNNIGENKSQENEYSNSEYNKTNDNMEEESIENGIYVPKQQLGVIDSNIQACRVATLVYKGRIYTIEGTELSLEEGKALVDKKIGVTWDLIEEIKEDGTSAGYIDLEGLKDFASIGEGDEVYTVNGYDESFRLITYTKNEYGEFISLWECLNDFMLADGSDVFGMMNIKDNIESATWKTFNNWNYGILDEKEVIIDDTLNNFIDAMYKGTPYSLEDEELRNKLFNKESNFSSGEDYFEANEERQKFMFLKMKDGTKVEIRLFRDGYIYYSGLNFAFKLDEESFANMWNELDL